ncbi:MAG TPA: zf-HC2 domain-containing protein [Bacteroidales bacterium]|nr:zf-HC2 domain-containing protein [Bacteroidales bacterium]
MKHLSEETIMGLCDGMLTLTEQAAAEAHIAACDDCREQLKLFQSLDAMLSAENILTAPPVITNRVMQQVELHNKIMLRKAQSRKTLLRFGIIMLVFMLALIVLAFFSGAVIEFQTPGWMIAAKDFFNDLKLPGINPVYLFIIVPVVFLLFAERLINLLRKQRLAVYKEAID